MCMPVPLSFTGYALLGCYTLPAGCVLHQSCGVVHSSGCINNLHAKPTMQGESAMACRLRRMG
jgi:hypothetical protein